jgi:hypothetical protein
MATKTKKKTAKKKVAKKKVAKKNTKSTNDEKKYVVITQNRSGQVDSIDLVNSKETGEKHSIIHNLSEGCWEQHNPGYEELRKKLIKLIREDKWKEVFEIWDEKGMDGYAWTRMAYCCELDEVKDCCELNEAEDLKTLWVYDEDECEED